MLKTVNYPRYKMGLAAARKMGGSATREPELIYVVRGASSDNPGGRQNPHPTVLLPSRPNVSFRARFPGLVDLLERRT